MKAINLNKYEYYDHDHRTRKAYRHLIAARNRHLWNQTNDLEFIQEVERIIFNEIPTDDLRYLNDGIKNGCYLTIVKELLRSTEGGNLYRLKTDLLTVY